MYFGCFLAAIIYHFVQVILKEESENERNERWNKNERRRERASEIRTKIAHEKLD